MPTTRSQTRNNGKASSTPAASKGSKTSRPSIRRVSTSWNPFAGNLFRVDGEADVIKFPVPELGGANLDLSAYVHNATDDTSDAPGVPDIAMALAPSKEQKTLPIIDKVASTTSDSKQKNVLAFSTLAYRYVKTIAPYGLIGVFLYFFIKDVIGELEKQARAANFDAEACAREYETLECGLPEPSFPRGPWISNKCAEWKFCMDSTKSQLDGTTIITTRLLADNVVEFLKRTLNPLPYHSLIFLLCAFAIGLHFYTRK